MKRSIAELPMGRPTLISIATLMIIASLDDDAGRDDARAPPGTDITAYLPS